MKYFGKKAAVAITALILGMSFSAQAERARLLADDMDALQARVTMIEKAENEILAEYFSVWNDDQSVGGFSLLLKAAREGKKVRILMDAMSNTVPDSLFGALLENGKDLKTGEQNLEIKVYNPLRLSKLMTATHRDHAKMLIVDGQDKAKARLITGGRNIGDKYFGLSKKRNFKDLDVMTEGETAMEARENFMQVWNSDLAKVPSIGRYTKIQMTKPCRGDSFHRERCERGQEMAMKAYNKQIDRINNSMNQMLAKTPEVHVDINNRRDWLDGVENYEKLEFLSHEPDKLVTEETNDMAHRLVRLGLKAKTELNILSPYLIPTEGMMKVFQRLIDRGVKVRIITNSLNSTDNLFAQAGYKGSKEAMIKMGVELYEYNGPDTAHAKVAVIDNKISVIGTYNLDPRSTDINREVGVAVEGQENNQLATSLAHAIDGFRYNSLLVGKDGQPQNKEMWDKGVSRKKLTTLKVLLMFLPHYRDQI